MYAKQELGEFFKSQVVHPGLDLDIVVRDQPGLNPRAILGSMVCLIKIKSFERRNPKTSTEGSHRTSRRRSKTRVFLERSRLTFLVEGFK